MTVVTTKITQGKGKGRRRRRLTLGKLYVWNWGTRRSRKITGSQVWWWPPRPKIRCEYEYVTNTLSAPLRMEDSK
jgi:hypothetical protein